eukprot:scaffold54828_cov30-Tisochrysis_lutea.AAC.19
MSTAVATSASVALGGTVAIAVSVDPASASSLRASASADEEGVGAINWRCKVAHHAHRMRLAQALHRGEIVVEQLAIWCGGESSLVDKLARMDLTDEKEV